MLNIFGNYSTTCERRSRRRALQIGGAGLFGLSVPKLFAAQEAQPFANGRAKSVIFLFLFGGPSQLETFDLKPEAPDAIRGPFKPIASRTPGLLIGEHLPLTANVTDRCAVIRTMSHDFNDHSGGGHYIQTGHRWHVPIGNGFNVTPKDWPAIGSVVEHLHQRTPSATAMPAYAVVPNSLGRLQEYKVQLRRPGETAGWLGRACDPLTTRIEKRDASDNPYWRECDDEELTYLDRMSKRKSLLTQFDDARRRLADKTVDTYSRHQQRALSLVTSEETRKALDITAETPALRDQYGRHLFGQSTLMARRLVEAGSRFVTVHYDCVDGYSWDSHRNSDDVKKHLLPTMDQALSALLLDLEQRGLLDETLVVCLGEMGRTPKANAQWGRNHWSTLFPAVLAGAGIRGGTIHGETDADAAYSPEDLAATIYHALGIDHELRAMDAQGRPTAIVDGGQPLLELFG